MGKKGGKGHLKREAAPGFWPIHRKKYVWTIKPLPGPHPIHQCLPLTLVVREILGLAKTRREAKKIVSQGKILVDGRIIHNERFPVGLMDVITIPETSQNYRVVPSEKGLFLHPISEDEAKFKICRIENKTTLEKGNIELNLHDGRNILVHVEDPQRPSEDVYNTLDTLKISIPEQEILEHLKLGKEALVVFADGNNIGKYGIVTSIVEQTGQKRKNFLITIQNEMGEAYQTVLNYAFVVGDKKPRISLPSKEDL
ncbi:MAG: 30S ribosomal protein S4e [Candidatus Bathyarchaeia archaeon]|nr:30S ribosomal protein S4e [Candidatus Bathyarchaeota archaeon]